MNNLRKYRKQQGFSQKELADAVNLTQMQISHYESGRNSPRVDSAMKILNFLRKKNKKITFMSLWDLKKGSK